MPYDANAKLFMFKIETTEGTDPTPVVGTDAILTNGIQVGFLETDSKVRQLDRPYYGAQPEVLSAARRSVQFSVEMAGAGGATTVPSWMKLNRICGFDAGAVGGSSVVQTPITASIPSATFKFNQGGLDIVGLGARGSLGFVIEDDEIPQWNYNLLGVPPSALAATVSLGTPDYTGFKDPMVASTANTTFTLDSYALPLRRIEVNENSDIALRSLIGPTDFIKWQNRSWEGSILCEVPTIATKDYFGKIMPGTTMPMAIAHGVGAGKIVEIAAPRVQITSGVQLSEEQGVVMASFPIKLLPNAGNDEIIITSK